MNLENGWEIIERIKKGDESAFAEIYETFKLPLYKFCVRMISDRDSALDIVHDVFLKLYENIYTIKPTSSLTSLLFKMARNRCLNFLRDRKAMIEIEQVEINSEHKVDKEFEMKEDSERLQKVLNSINDDYREILILKEWGGLSYAEIAEILDTTIPAVKAKLFKARKKLAEIYKKFYGDEVK